MSEANLPSDPSQKQTPPHSIWDNSANADQTNTDGIAETQVEDWQDWQTVDFPNVVSADAIERQSIYSSDDVPPLDWLAQATPTPSAAHLWSTGAGNSIEPPEIADLIALIQELNQCNDVLLDRVSQLEESLERSQKAQSQANRSSQASDAHQTSNQITQELIAAQAEITQLSQDLEFAQQTNQRQQILIETLTGQLEGSQERVAQLERECALTQQRYSEQSHQLTQSETACRDLHARLQRQQQYTLQFKAALEKCLEVPPPSYEVKEQAVEAIAPSEDKHDSSTPQSFLPKAKRIQPWSAQPQFLGDLSDLNVGELENLDETQISLRSQVETQDSRQFHPLAAAALDLPTVLASIIHPDSSASDEPAIELPTEPPSTASNAATPVNLQPLSYDLKKSAGWWNEAASQPKSANLAPKLPQADQTRSEIQQVDYPATSSETSISAPISVEAAENDLHTTPTFSEESVPSQPSEAEDALWQDLARLIDVSTDDVVKVSVSDDFDSFEAIAPSSEPQPAPSLTDLPAETPSNQPQSTLLDVEQQIAEGISIAKLLLSSAQATAAEQPTPAPDTSDPKTSESEQKVPAAFTTHSNWPSPIVYPLRTSKKIESLAAVKLPTFPR
ncbi:hypothetical protein H6F95_26320 [Cyanobacteria bacterium FACHB-471]|nr:hypothetical protein [Cyanobacteria bacterium FACHB-471]